MCEGEERKVNVQSLGLEPLKHFFNGSQLGDIQSSEACCSRAWMNNAEVDLTKYEELRVKHTQKSRGYIPRHTFTKC